MSSEVIKDLNLKIKLSGIGINIISEIYYNNQLILSFNTGTKHLPEAYAMTKLYLLQSLLDWEKYPYRHTNIDVKQIKGYLKDYPYTGIYNEKIKEE